MSKTFKIVLFSCVGAFVVASTILFPLITDINKTINQESTTHIPTDQDSNKTIQTFSVESSSNLSGKSNTSSMVENPVVTSETTTNATSIYKDDTIKSSYLQEDVPHYKRN